MLKRISMVVIGAVVLVTGAATGSAHAQDAIPCTKVKIGDWWFVPIYTEEEGWVNAMFAYYAGEQAVGANITSALFERAEDNEWTALTWPNADRGQAAAYTLFRWGEQGRQILRDGELAGFLDEDDYKNAENGGPEPDEFATGIASSDPMWGYIQTSSEPGKLLEDLRQAGWAVAPQWSAIATLTAIRNSGDEDAFTTAVGVAIGGIAPIDTCDKRVETISLKVTTVGDSVAGTQLVLNDAASSAESALFGSSSIALGWFCSGCTYSYTSCVGTGGWRYDGRTPTPGGWNCAFSRSGTHTCTGVTGLTWLCCNTCAACPTGATSCTEVNGCTVTNPAPCPAPPAGCP